MTQICKHISPTPKLALKQNKPFNSLLNSELFKALSDNTRLLLLACLTKCVRPCSLGEIAECCEIDLSVVSRHMSILARQGVVLVEKKGRTVYYSTNYEYLTEYFLRLSDAFRNISALGQDGGCCG